MSLINSELWGKEDLFALQVPAKDAVFPCYQPIVSLETGYIIGYEVLGRSTDGAGNLVSLGPFFTNPNVSTDLKRALDRVIRKQALATLAKENTMIFLNLKPEWLAQHNGEKEKLFTLELLAAYGIDPRRVVIEVTEESCRQTLAMEKTLAVFREAGCHVAIDDAGAAYSNLDRIGLLAPEIIKLDCRPFHSSPYGREVVISLGRLAERLGALLLVECVEDEEWLKFGLKAGATYAQGFFFAPAQPTLLPPEKFVPVVKHVARQLYHEEKDALTSELVLWRRLVALLEEVMTEPPFAIDRLLPLLPPVVFRLYLCTPSGEQVSPNFTRDKGGFWREEPDFIGHNWAWRPYFRELRKQLLCGSPWAISEPYRDRHTRELVRTFVFRLPEGLLLLIDLVGELEQRELQGSSG